MKCADNSEKTKMFDWVHLILWSMTDFFFQKTWGDDILHQNANLTNFEDS